jgi:ribonuclease VapC
LIVLDTSALLAVLLGEPEGPACIDAMAASDTAISAATLAEAYIVAGIRGLRTELGDLIASLDPEVAPVTAATARQVGESYMRFGKGLHPAGLNFGDCFAYVLARERDCAVLFVGRDFSRTDARSALAG